ncbi:NAC domain-containing protein [Actinidia chinensis var. chinensis]|uniref:NAC domain-containing protein n=1 Tax=Actinidia chinensis var. chinensis TaxID=1590841 RepID=A0A2R6S2U1_ACTCC|nr:NAC domain-containing protein [Actinidia chinensis var. chinensis]
MGSQTSPELELPGFRFHPTEEELLHCYLIKIAMGQNLSMDVIDFLNIYHHEPWELPGFAKVGEREWYFFVPRDRRHGHGGRPNRTTKEGFWKATGSDRPIHCSSNPKKILGIKKTLVFYGGRAPRGSRTDWVMNEYRLPDDCSFSKEDIVLCKVYRKATSMKVLEERANMEKEIRITHPTLPCPPTSQQTLSARDPQEYVAVVPTMPLQDIVWVTEKEHDQIRVSSSSIGFGLMKEDMTELEVPTFSMDLAMDPWLGPLRSPCLED